MRPATQLLFWLGVATSLVDARDSSVNDADGSVWQKLASQPRGLSRAVRKSHQRRLNCRQTSSTGWNPPSTLATPLQEVWDHTLETYNSGDAMGFTNYGWDQIMATKG